MTSGASVSIPIRVSGFTRVTTFQFTLQWSINALIYAGLDTTLGLVGLTSGNFGTSSTDAGRLTVSWDAPDAVGKTVAEGTAIFSVNFLGKIPGATTPLGLTDSPTPREVTIDMQLATFNISEGTLAVAGASGGPTPAIVAQPQSQTVTVGGSVHFIVVATGDSPLRFQWRRDGTAISGATGSSYGIANVLSSHAGVYSVVVSNAVGTVTSSNASLTVVIPPAIATQPQSQTVTNGANVIFSVLGTGDGPLTYQWRKDGLAINGATNVIYTISSAQTCNGGVYSVVVTSSAGSVMSRDAALAVAAPNQVVHCADYRDPRWIIDGTEANRVLSYWRAGAYHIDAVGFDGYAPGTSAASGLRHSADYQTNHWVIDASEANRVLAYWCTGGYHPDAAGLDGYVPGTNTVGLQSFSSARRLAASAVQSQHDTRATYQAGGVVEVNIELSYQIRPLGLLLRPTLPPQWKLVSVTGDGNPEAIQGEILWTGTIPSSPVKVAYRLEVPAGETGVRTIAEKLEWFASGQSNPQESNVGTEALLVGARGSGFAQLNKVARLENGEVRLNLRAENGRRYKVEKSADLSHWSGVTTVNAGEAGMEIKDANTTSSGRQFYRAILVE